MIHDDYSVVIEWLTFVCLCLKDLAASLVLKLIILTKEIHTERTAEQTATFPEQNVNVNTIKKISIIHPSCKEYWMVLNLPCSQTLRSHSMHSASVSGHIQACVLRHFLPWHTQASQKSHTAPLGRKRYILLWRCSSSSCSTSNATLIEQCEHINYLFTTGYLIWSNHNLTTIPIPVLWIPGCLMTQSDDFMHLVFP